MLKRIKRKFLSFFEGYFVEILNNQQKIQKEHDCAQERLTQRLLQLENDNVQIKSFQHDIYNRVVTTEDNLNYYSMIRSIMDESTYTNNELLFLQIQKSNSPKILVGGFFGADNFGDELMLQTLLSCIPEEFLSSVTVMLCNNTEYDYCHLPGINFIHMPTKKFDCNFLAQYFDVLIWGGGALIDDTDYSQGTLTLNNLVITLSQRFIAFHKKVIALGLSSNRELLNSDYIEALRYVCDNSTYFSLRDKNSQSLLKKAGIDNTELIDDLVFYNKIWENKLSAKATAEAPTVGIIWICYEDTESLFLSLIAKLREKFGIDCKIKCIPFYDYTSADVKYFSRMIEKIENNSNISIVPYSNHLDKVVFEIADTDYMVNMRYHGMLLSGLLNKESLNICYDTHRHYLNKVEYLAEVFRIKKELLFFSEFIKNPERLQLTFTVSKADVNELVRANEELTNIILSNLQ